MVFHFSTKWVDNSKEKFSEPKDFHRNVNELSWLRSFVFSVILCFIYCEPSDLAQEKKWVFSIIQKPESFFRSPYTGNQCLFGFHSNISNSTFNSFTSNLEFSILDTKESG